MKFLRKAQKRSIATLDAALKEATALMERLHNVMPLLWGGHMSPGQYHELQSMFAAAELEIKVAHGVATALGAATPSHYWAVLGWLMDSLNDIAVDLEESEPTHAEL
jgi:cellobiose-specific phosphotransferase system component IIA